MSFLRDFLARSCFFHLPRQRFYQPQATWRAQDFRLKNNLQGRSLVAPVFVSGCSSAPEAALTDPLAVAGRGCKPDSQRGLTKKQIRSKILLKLKTQKEEERDRKSKLIQKRLFRTQLFKKAKKVMFYISFDGEVNTQDMIKEALKLGKIVAVPSCVKYRIMRPCIFQSRARLRKGLYGVYEPAIKRFVNLEELDIVIVPGVAFDRKGKRLGRGKGYYDRFLKKLPKSIPSIGLAFDFQILPFIPATKRDIGVQRVLNN